MVLTKVMVAISGAYFIMFVIILNCKNKLEKDQRNFPLLFSELKALLTVNTRSGVATCLAKSVPEFSSARKAADFVELVADTSPGKLETRPKD